jgi:hypothetical protein
MACMGMVGKDSLDDRPGESQRLIALVLYQPIKQRPIRLFAVMARLNRVVALNIVLMQMARSIWAMTG